MDSEKKLIVFDLDYTLWPLHVDECVPPFRKDSLNGAVYDSKDRLCYLYRDVKDILQFLKKKRYILAVASRAKNICGSYQLLHMFDIAEFFPFKEIYPGSKNQHFTSLQVRTGISPENMYFFDNDSRNIRDVEKLGVHCFLISDEITVRCVCSALNPKRRQ